MATAFIKKIDRLKDFGSFENFLWNTDLPEFRKNNLFYGKNGSGKTTLSQFFQSFEDGKLPEDFGKLPTMEITTSQGTHSNLNALTGRVKVFNTYYIKKNLHWEGGHATNLLWLGKVDIKIQTAIGELDKEIDQLYLDIPALEENARTCASNLDRLLIDHSKIIRLALAYPQSQYQKTHLSKDFKELLSGKLVATNLSDEEYRAKVSVAVSGDAGIELSPYVQKILDLPTLAKSVLHLVSEKIMPAIAIDELIQDPALKRWVEEGLKHHDEAGECKFCKEGRVTENRLADLRKFFDVSQAQFSSKLDTKSTELIKLIKSLDDNIEQTTVSDDFTTENSAAIGQLKKQRELIKQSLEKLLVAIDAKKNDLFRNFESECAEIETTRWSELLEKHQAAVDSINQVYMKHNEQIRNFTTVKKAAAREIELHLALQQKDEFSTRVRLAEDSEEARTKAITSNKDKIAKRIALKGQISSSHQAAEYINNLLRQMGHIHIKLEYDATQQAYLLKRGNAAAKRLSEGEKTAVSFAHFVACLYQEDFNLAESIIVIDDPISSLDTTASYFIYGLVKSLEVQAGQLFLMTHSHSFFVLLIKHFRGKLHGHYEVQKFTTPGSDLGVSKIVKMDEQKTKYYTEYNYLFSLVYTAAGEIKSGQDISFDRLYTLMNSSRKMLEAFLGFKYPNELGDLDKKFKNAVDDYGIDIALQHATYKIINFGSHSGVDGFLVGSGLDKIEMAESVELVLDFMKQVDVKHFDGMVHCQAEGTLQAKAT